jgi:DNA-binding SARP family transcriptional activator
VLDLWRSGVLADLADYAFTRPEAARLEELRLAALEARIDADLALGRHDALTAELEQLAAEHPLRQRLHGQLMLALYRCGRLGLCSTRCGSGNGLNGDRGPGQCRSSGLGSAAAPGSRPIRAQPVASSP